jgi:hypothetical protein
MVKRSNFDKGFYIGYSQGTVQMFYALAHREEEILASKLHGVLQFAPCTICPEPRGEDDETWLYDGLYSFPEVGVYDLYGPDYYPDEYDRICDELGADACTYAGNFWNYPMSVQSETHWWQNSYTNRF